MSDQEDEAEFTENEVSDLNILVLALSEVDFSYSILKLIKL